MINNTSNCAVSPLTNVQSGAFSYAQGTELFLSKTNVIALPMADPSSGFQDMLRDELEVAHQATESDYPGDIDPPMGIVQDDGASETQGTINVERVISAWNDFKGLRDSVARTRLALRELRVELRQERVQARALEAQLWRNIESHWAEDRHDKTTLERLHGELNKARDEIGPKEESYDELEDDFEVMEYRLEKRETRFYSQFAHSQSEQRSKSPISDSSYEGGQAWSRSRGSEYTDTRSTPSYKYLSKVGDANIIKERLAELEAERDHYLDVNRERNTTGQPLYQPNVEFLENFSKVHDRYLEQLRQIYNDLDTLSRNAGIEHTESEEMSSLASQVVASRATSLHGIHVYPTSLRDSYRRSSDGDIRHHHTSTSRQYINQWILDALTHSGLERARHKSILEDPGLNDAAWLKLVCEYWGQDPAAYSLHNSPRGDRLACPGTASSAHREGETDITLTEVTSNGTTPTREIDDRRRLGIHNMNPADPFVDFLPKTPSHITKVRSDFFPDEIFYEKDFQSMP